MTVMKLVRQEGLEESSKRTPKQRLKALDDMFGEGKGAKKERAKLAKLLAKS